jgi:8-amino-7-oxononanoate synthase
VYEHRDPADLERQLAAVPRDSRVLVVTDGVFSMEGDLAPCRSCWRSRSDAE